MFPRIFRVHCYGAPMHFAMFLAASLFLGSERSLRSAPPPTSLGHPSFAIPRYNGDYLNIIRTDRLGTPHVPFATPLNGGPLRVLFVVPMAGYCSRDVVELAERLDLKFKSVTTYRPNQFFDDHPYTTAVLGQSTIEKTRELENKLLERYDVIVLANVNFDKLPVSCRFLLLKAVKAGTGLVQFFANTRSRKTPFYQPFAGVSGRDIVGGLALTGTWLGRSAKYRKLDAPALADAWVKPYRFGTGRVAVVYPAAGNLQPYPKTGGMGYACIREPGTYDVAMQIAAKSLLWAAGRSEEEGIKCDWKDGRTFHEAAPLSCPVSIEFPTDASSSAGLQIEFWVRDVAGELEFHGVIPSAAGARGAEVSLPALPNGRHFLTLALRNPQGRALDFCSRTLVMDAPARIRIQTDNAALASSDSADLTIAVDAPPPNATVTVRGVDVYGRLFFREQFPAKAEKRRVRMPLETARGRYVRVVAALAVGDVVWAAAEQELFLRTSRQLERRFVRLMWGAPGISRANFLWDLAGAQLQRAGVTHGMIFTRKPADAVTAARALDRADQGWMVYAAHVDPGRIKKYYDPTARRREEQTLETMARALRDYGTYLYSLGDENSFSYKQEIAGPGLSAFQAFLRKRYERDINRLNRLWKTNFADFAAVRPLADPTVRDNGASVPRRYDQMLFQETVYADTHRWMAAAIRRGDPDARVGAEGSMPGDLESTISGLDWWAPYEDRLQNAVLAFWMQEAHRGNWWGAYTANHGARVGVRVLWHQLLSGAVNSSMFFVAFIASEGMFSTDLHYADFYAGWLPELQRIQRGVGTLLRNSHLADDGVAVYWSKANDHASALYPEFGSASLALNSLTAALQERGVNPRFVTPEQIRTRGIGAGRVRVLLLIHAMVIPDEILPVLADFVRKGGAVVADIAPGGVSPFMELRAPAPGLRAVFGIAKPEVAVVESKASGAGAGVRIPGAPSAVLHRFGKGRALLLNRDYSSLVATPESTITDDLLRFGGVTPFITAARPRTWEFITRFRHADAWVLGLERRSERGPDVLKLPGEFRVVDLKNGKPLGVSGEISVGSGTHQFLYGLLPAAVRRIRLRASSRVRRGKVLHVSCRVLRGRGAVENSLLRFDLSGPDGRRRAGQTAFAFSGDETRDLRFPIALNAPQGKWRLRVEELCSGARGEARFRVR
ncbi:MAG: hypothetical protein GXP31_07770 [Kiritimatiellaeota bacterium]|nr:hypothetical protein [Kiritimatiellota bacterium]